MEGAFCAKCGASAGQSAPAQSASQQAPPPPPPGAQAGGLSENAASALCYILTIITGILFLALEPYNRNPVVRFHAWQAILLFIAYIGAYIVVFFLVWMLPWFISGLLSMLLWFGFLVAWVFLMWQAYNGKKVVLPLIGQIAESQARG